MTFAEFKIRLGKGILRDDLADSLGDFTNEALREVQNRRSWTFQKASASLDLGPGAGNETAELPADFKELQKHPSVFYVTIEGSRIPAEVVFESQQIRRVAVFGGTPASTWPPRLYFERRASTAVIGVIEPLSEALTFQANYYAYLPDLSADDDTSLFITSYPKLVLAKAKSIAFSEINDPTAAFFEAEFEKKLTEAIRQDSYSEVAGRTLRM